MAVSSVETSAPPASASARPRPSPGVTRRTLQRILRQPGGLFGLAVLASLVLVAILAPQLARHDPLRVGAGPPLNAPSLAHPFGTDDLGRDELSRIIYGARISLTVSFLSAVIALAVAVPLGLTAGYAGGAVDSTIGRFFDTIFAFPSILLGIGLVAVLGSSIFNVVIAVAIINLPTLGRLTRVAVLGQRREEYVEAARVLGASTPRILGRHIFPNVLPVLLVQTALMMGEAVLLEAAFSFLGLGSRPPAPSWGTMLNNGRNFLVQAPWLGLFPGLVITITILGLNALSDAMRAALAPGAR
jgi:peptide/nickel transport system permease protein/oligopeptide transport system permease protein